MPILTLRRLILATLCGLAAWLVPALAHADSLRADLDGDGVRDRIEYGQGSRALAIRFSATHRWQRLHSGDLIVTFVVTDVDRDGDPDLVANTRQSGLLVWINKGRGLFSTRSKHLRSRHPRLALHHPKPRVQAVQIVRLDDSTLNDSNRLLIVDWVPARARLVPVGDTAILTDSALTDFTSRRRPPRGPPARLVS